MLNFNGFFVFLHFGHGIAMKRSEGKTAGDTQVLIKKVSYLNL